MKKISIENIKSLFGKNREFIVPLVLLLGIFTYAICRIYGPIDHPDEIGYWANAAKMAGYDWSRIASLNSYYSYGYSFLLLPIILVCKDMVLAYRMAIGMNCVFLCITCYIFCQILARLLWKTEKKTLIYLAVIAVFYPSLIFYMQMTLAETLLVMLYALFCLELLIYLEKPKCLHAMLMAATLIYIYIVHMRTIAVVISACAVMLILIVKESRYRRTGIIFFVSIIVFMMCARIGKNWMMQYVYQYASKSSLSVNDYAGQVDKIHILFSLKGFYQLAVSVAGKVFYLTAATFGTILWGFSYIWKELKNRRKVWFYSFILFSGVATLLVTSVYTMHGTRMDSLLYGRYTEHIVPLLICFGLVRMLQSRYLIKVNVMVAVGQAVLLFFLQWIYRTHDYSGMHECFIAGTAYAWYLCAGNVGKMLTIVFLCSTGMMLFLSGLLLVSEKGKINKSLFCLLLVIELGISMPINEGFVYWNNEFNKEDQMVVEKIAHIMMSSEEKIRIVFANSEGLSNIGVLQLALKEYPIEVIDTATLKAWMKQGNILTDKYIIITYANNEAGEMLEKKYQVLADVEDFIVYTNAE